MAHPLAPFPYAPEIVVAFRANAFAEVLYEGLAEAVDTPQGRPQVMRDRIAEGLEALHGSLELGCPFPYLVLELDIELYHLVFGQLALGYVLDRTGHHYWRAGSVTDDLGLFVDDPYLAGRQHYPVVYRIIAPEGNRAVYGRVYEVPVFGVDRAQKGLVCRPELRFRDAEHTVYLIRPEQFVLHHVPVPVAYVRDALRVFKPFLAQGQGLAPVLYAPAHAVDSLSQHANLVFCANGDGDIVIASGDPYRGS